MIVIVGHRKVESAESTDQGAVAESADQEKSSVSVSGTSGCGSSFILAKYRATTGL